MTSFQRCERLDWDSAFFGVNIARVLADRVSPESAIHIDRWCDENEIDCIYFFARAGDLATEQTAMSAGYKLVDVRISFETSARTFELPVHIRPAKSTDVPRLRQIARTGHVDTRFFFDPRFDPHKAQLLYERWIENSVNGFAQAVFVAEAAGAHAGYVTCHLKNGAGSIGLIAVDAAHRGRGLGRDLVRAGVDWLSRNGAGKITVATQARNVAAQRLYYRCEFMPYEVQWIYHKWFARKESN